jgi:hypothetical protein
LLQQAVPFGHVIPVNAEIQSANLATAICSGL